MFLLIILSFLLGCATTIALLLYLYTRYTLYPPVIYDEASEEQYETFHPLPEVSSHFTFHKCILLLLLLLLS